MLYGADDSLTKDQECKTALSGAIQGSKWLFECPHYKRKLIDYIENEDTGETFEGEFEQCIECDEVLSSWHLTQNVIGRW